MTTQISLYIRPLNAALSGRRGVACAGEAGAQMQRRAAPFQRALGGARQLR